MLPGATAGAAAAPAASSPGFCSDGGARMAAAVRGRQAATAPSTFSAVPAAAATARQRLLPGISPGSPACSAGASSARAGGRAQRSPGGGSAATPAAPPAETAGCRGDEGGAAGGPRQQMGSKHGMRAAQRRETHRQGRQAAAEQLLGSLYACPQPLTRARPHHHPQHLAQAGGGPCRREARETGARRALKARRAACP